MEVVGICGSDVHYLVDGRIGPFVVEKPMVIGHEASGTVLELGRNVKHLKEGDHVAIEPGSGCRRCKYCKTGRYNLCPDMRFCATPPIDGNLARYYVHDADFCFKLPSHVSVEEGALLEPLSCGVRACKRGGVTIGSTVLILGAGPIGLTSLLAAKAFGASRIVIADFNESRLELAERFGANCTIQVCPDDEENDVIEHVYEAFDNKQPSVSIECSGAEMGIRIAILVTKTGGKAVLLGMGKTEINLPLGSALFREVDIKGVFRYVNDYPTSLDMVATGKVDVLPLITHQFPLEETLEAFETARTGAGNAIKVLIRPNTDSSSNC
ncbi:hypothetical protein ILUMI_12733 [Ignelater luminosus]|uniref:Sorbitol dehydrogenase n=1 Tax=Ignelater luminosus TaxID=2038154 RepID=A0A8K0CZ17_IGNLU|nr:hypothetical protein ILUMI_12733 [Ignelater luminosus]